jgi:hypothetical protein
MVFPNGFIIVQLLLQLTDTKVAFADSITTNSHFYQVLIFQIRFHRILGWMDETLLLFESWWKVFDNLLFGEHSFFSWSFLIEGSSHLEEVIVSLLTELIDCLLPLLSSRFHTFHLLIPNILIFLLIFWLNPSRRILIVIFKDVGFGCRKSMNIHISACGFQMKWMLHVVYFRGREGMSKMIGFLRVNHFRN